MPIRGRIVKGKYKVFHGLVNYGSQAGYLARGLRNRGIEAISVCYDDRFDRPSDISLKGQGGNRSIISTLKVLSQRLRWFKEYDIFHFYFGTSLLPHELDLPFYKLFGKKVVMEYLGNDVQLYRYSIEKYKYTNQKYYHDKYQSLKSDRRKKLRLKLETPFLNKQLVCAPYLSEFAPNSVVFPLAIDLNEYDYSPMSVPEDEIRIMHAPTHRGNKGTSFIIEAIERLRNEGVKIQFTLIENISHSELKRKYKECDIFIDQVLGGWYGTASIEAMATGRPTVCFLREAYFEYIDYADSIPIINAGPDTLYDALKATIYNKEILPKLGEKSRKFVEEVHSLDKCTDKLVELYKRL